MKDFKNRLMHLIDSSALQAKSFVEGVNEFVDSFDFNAQIDRFNEKKNELIKRGNEFFGEFTELLKQVKDSFTDFSVTVPFDESIGENVSYEVKDGKLEIEVSFTDEKQTRSSKTSVVIPSNCDVEKIAFSSNSTLKTATVTIPKKVAETPLEENATPTENHAEVKISKKLAEKLTKNGSKYASILKRASDGHFVRKQKSE